MGADSGQQEPAAAEGLEAVGAVARSELRCRCPAAWEGGMGWGGIKLRDPPGGGEEVSERLGAGLLRRRGGLRVGSLKAEQKADWGAGSGSPIKKERLWGKGLG